MEAENTKHTSLKDKAIEELKIFLIVTLYLFLFLGAFTLYRWLIQKEFEVTYFHFGIALIEALVIAKVILIGKAFGLGRHFERGPLIVSVLYKSFLFGVLVALFGILEHVVEGLLHKKDWASILQGLGDIGKYELFARSIMLIVAFVPFFAFAELARVLGRQKLSALFFSKQMATSASQSRG